MREVNDLLGHKDSPARVQALPSVVLHRLIAELTPEESSEIIELARPAQVREVIDLQVWDGDRINTPELLSWLQVLTSLSSEDARASHFAALDVELLGYALRSRARIFLKRDDDLPDQPEGVYYQTPDGWFVIDLLVHSRSEADDLIAVIDALYIRDHEEARRLLHNLMWELPSQLEELSLRWRSGRLADLGFHDTTSGLDLYRFLDPDSVDLDDGSADQALRADPDPAGVADLTRVLPTITSFFSDTLTRLESTEQQRIASALLWLANRSLAADKVSPADLQTAERSLTQLHWRLSLGLEYLSKGDHAVAERVLARVALLRLAQVGHSLVLRLRKKIVPLRHAARLGRRSGQLDLLDAPLDLTIPPLMALRPQFCEITTKAAFLRPFKTRDDLRVASDWVGETILSASLAPTDGLPPNLPEGATLGSCFRTDVVARLLRHKGPLDRDAVATFRNDYFEEGRLVAKVHQLAMLIARDRLGSSAEHDLGKRLVERWLAVLEAELGPLQADFELKYLASVIVQPSETPPS